MSVNGAVDEFIKNLELTPREQAEASRQHVFLRDSLVRVLELDPNHNARLMGSYSRSTAIRPLKDIDVFCVLKRTDGLNPLRLTPFQALNKIKTALQTIYNGKVAEPQRRSVNIEFSGTNIAYDVVPAFLEPNLSEEVFIIPDVHQAQWIHSNPRVHEQMSTDANKRADSELKPLTKAVKHWNRQQPKNMQLRSFHIEVMAWEVLQKKPENRLEGLRILFNGLAARVITPMPDPARLGPPIDDGMTTADRIAAKRQLEAAASTIGEAIRFKNAGQFEAAHHKLFSVFGDPYPEKGKIGS